MIKQVEVKLYKVLAKLARTNRVLRMVILRVLPSERIRNLNIKTDIKLRSGEVFRVFTKHWIGFRCFFSGSYDIEANEELHMIRTIKRLGITTFFDVGANHGYYSLKIASLLPQGGKVYAFEPFSSNVELLKTNIKNNNFLGKIEVIEKVISNKHGTQNIYYAGDKNPGASSCVAYDASKKFEEVESITLDSFVSTLGHEVDFLKIDVEGFELNVLQGMRDILLEQKPILFIEHNTETLQCNDNTIADLLGYMKSFEYKPYDISSKTILPYGGGDKNLVLYCHKSKIDSIMEQ